MDANSFSPGQEPCRKARPPLTNLPGFQPGKRQAGCLFFWLLFLTAGILPSALRADFAVRARSCACVGKQRKVTRPPAGGRKPAAGEHAGDNATTRDWLNWTHAFAGRRTRGKQTVSDCLPRAQHTQNGHSDEPRSERRRRRQTPVSPIPTGNPTTLSAIFPRLRQPARLNPLWESE